jgi:hypothetical protein
MERGLIAPLSPHEEVTLRRIALGISKARQLPPRDVAHLIRLCLVADNEGRLSLTDIGRERYRALPKAAGMTAVADEGEPKHDRSAYEQSVDRLASAMREMLGIGGAQDGNVGTNISDQPEANQEHAERALASE